MRQLDTAIGDLLRSVSEQIILPRFRNLSAADIADKGGNDPVTLADREAEAALQGGLATLEQDLNFVGEELVHANPATRDHLTGDCWIVDPIDGTRNFAGGRAPFGVMIARAEGGLAQSGWIYDCPTGRLCVAHRGGGAFVDGERVAARASGRVPPVAAISLTYMNEAQRQAMERHVCPHYMLAEVPHCAAEQYPRLANGRNDVALFQRTLAWDHAAGCLWLEEAGGKAARPDGSAYRVDEPDRTGLIAAASPALWQGMAERLERI